MHDNIKLKMCEEVKMAEILIEYEKEKVILEYFTKYVNKYIHNFNLDKNQILFLFNKYKIEYHSTPVVLTYLRDKKLYSLKYIFTLI